MGGATGRTGTARAWAALGTALLLGYQPLSQAALGGAVYDWGDNALGQAPQPPPAATGSNIVAVAAGVQHSLALKNNGTVLAWGWNAYGQTTVPAGLTSVIALAAGSEFSLALRSTGTVVPWGGNTYGEKNVPVGLANVTQIAAGWKHCLALQQNGTITAWGDDTYGEIDIPAGLGTVVAVAGGDNFSVALSPNGTVTAWGDGSYGKTAVPAALTNVVGIAAGANHVLALLSDGTITAWGDNTYGQCTVPSLSQPVVMVSAGAHHSMALLADGNMLAWGDNTYGQGVVGPVLPNFFTLAAGGYHCLAVHGNGTPVIMAQPISQSVEISTPVVFTVLAGGQQPLAYQWKKNGTPITGATTSAFAIPSVLQTDAGSYTVVVTNTLGSVVSQPAVLSPFGLPPTITLQPVGTNVICGQAAQFSSAAIGPQPITYQWQFYATNLPGATSPNLTISPALNADVGAYDVVISNPYGAVTSSVASLGVSIVPITAQPQDTNAACGTSAGFSVTVGGPGPLSYQWQYYGTNLAGATGSSLLISPVLLSNAGPYDVVITCACGTTNSQAATLNVTVQPPSITSPLVETAAQGAPFNYQITALNSPTYFAATPLPAGLTFNPTNGLISGTNVDVGTFGIHLTAYNLCSSDMETLILTNYSSVPVITSPLTATGIEGADFSYTITITNAPGTYGAANLPIGLVVDPVTGMIAGQPAYAGNFYTTISATNAWGSTSATLAISISNAPIAGLAIVGVSTNYSAPYLLDFQFGLVGTSVDDTNTTKPFVADPSLLSVQAYENQTQVDTVETSVILKLLSPQSISLEACLVLDFSENIANTLVNGDTNNNGISDSIYAEVSSAETFVGQQPASAKLAVVEFHRDDAPPALVIGLTNNQTAVIKAIGGIETNYVKGFSSGARLWDSLGLAVSTLGTNKNPAAQSCIVVVTDGIDHSSTNTLTNVVMTATNSNIKIYAIGFGYSIDTNVLASLTAQTGGAYYTGTNGVQMASEFAQISKALTGQYRLRWATTARVPKPFLPSFVINYGGYSATSPPPFYGSATNYVEIDTNANTTNTYSSAGAIPTPIPSTAFVNTNTTNWTNYIISPYTPTTYAGDVTRGTMHLGPTPAVLPAGVTLTADYVPRDIRQFLIHYRANWPCTLTPGTNAFDLLTNWTMITGSDGSNGTLVTLSSSSPTNSNGENTSITFADWGDVLHFQFYDQVPTNNPFALFQVITNIYAASNNILGYIGQSFVVSNAPSFTTNYPSLPYGTPVPWLLSYGITSGWTNAEVADPDLDGALTWQEYVANTNPTNAASAFRLLSVEQTQSGGRYAVTFTSALNRYYTLYSSTDLTNWTVIQDNIQGTGTNITAVDTRYLTSTNVFYRVQVHL